MRKYPFPLNDAAKSSLGKLDSAMQWHHLMQAKGDRRYRVDIFDVVHKTRLSEGFINFDKIRGHKFYHKRFSRRIRARVYVSQLVFGAVVTVSTSLPFTLTGKSLVTIGNSDSVLSVLNLRLSKASRRKKNSFRRSWVSRVKQSRPNPEQAIGQVPKFRYDAGTYTNQGFDSLLVYNRGYSSVRTPGFQTLARKHKLPVNPHSVNLFRRFDSGSVDQQEVLDNPNFSTLKFSSYFSHLGTSDYGPTHSTSHNAIQRNKAIDRLGDAIRGETSNLSESIATIRRTFDMVGSNVSRIATSVRFLKRGNISAATKELFHGTPPRYRKNQVPSNSKSLAQNWLELQYGWKPLLNDIRYAITALGKLDLQDRSVGTARASATSEVFDGGILRPNSGSSSPACGSWYKRSRTTTKFVVRYKVASPLRAFLAQSGFTNPVSLAWELLPFSFVVDWLLPIGSYLESIDSWGGLEMLDGCETTFTRVEYGYQRSYYGQTWPDGALHSTSIWSQSGSLFYYGILLDRIKLSSLPNKRLPSFKNPFSFEHTLNGLALLRQLFK